MTPEDVLEAIDRSYAKGIRTKTRDYIGASNIGNPCDALLAMSLRGFPEDSPEPFLQRIFTLGHRLEDMVVADLKKAGIRVWEEDGLTGQQYSYELYGGHISAHMDGHVELEFEDLAVLEIKSMNDASFSKFQTHGVKVSHLTYYAQVQTMMGMSGIPKTLFIAYCKNNSRYHAEIVEFDPIEWAYHLQRAERILGGDCTRIATTKDDWRCNGCFKFSSCWGLCDVPVRCNTCAHAEPATDGSWVCVKGGKPPNTCPSYERFTVQERVVK